MSMSLTAKRIAWTEVNQSLGISPMDHLFNRLDGLYPGKWRKEFPTDTSIQNWKEAWSEAFVEEGITGDEVKAALIYCRRNLAWPPSLPEFLQACRPPLDYEAAYHEAIKQIRLRYNGDGRVEYGADKWSNPAIFWAAVAIGGDMNTTPYQLMKGRWKAALDEAVRDPKPVPAFAPALAAPGRLVTAPEEARTRIRGLVELLAQKVVVKPAEPVADEKPRRTTEELEQEIQAAARAVYSGAAQ